MSESSSLRSFKAAAAGSLAVSLWKCSQVIKKCDIMPRKHNLTSDKQCGIIMTPGKCELPGASLIELVENLMTTITVTADAVKAEMPTHFWLMLPGIFWDDHYDRCADHEGERIEIKREGRRVAVRLDAEALEDLRSDADYYADANGPDVEGLEAIKRSAKATLRAINKQVVR